MTSLLLRMFEEDAMGRIKVNLTLNAEVTKTARSLDLNMSHVGEAAIAEAAKIERNHRWRAENRAALEAYAEEIAGEGLALTAFTSF